MSVNNDRFRQRIHQRVTVAKGKHAEVYRRLFLDIDNRLTAKSPVDTGRFKNNWNWSSGTIDFSTTDAVSSAPFGASDGKNIPIIASLKIDGRTVYCTNSLPYAKRIDDGMWSKQAWGGVVSVTIAELKGAIRAIGAQVRLMK